MPYHTWKQIVLYIGLVLAYLMGSGFATGQELLQYFVPFGSKNILVAILVAALLILANFGFSHFGKNQALTDKTNAFTYYAGPVLGRIFDWFTCLFCFMGYIVMLAGAGSTLAQQYDAPLLIGVLVLTSTTILTVSLGLNNIVKILGNLGPVLAMLVVVIGVISLARYDQNLAANIQLIESGELPLLKASSNWVLASFSYAGMSFLMMSRTIEQLGRNKHFPTLIVGLSLGVIIYCAICILMSSALLSDITNLAGKQIPNLILASQISSFFGITISIIIFTAIYTTACPLLWSASSKLRPENKNGFKVTTLILGIIATVIALSIPFDILINYIYVISGYVGAILFICIFLKYLSRILYKFLFNK